MDPSSLKFSQKRLQTALFECKNWFPKEVKLSEEMHSVSAVCRWSTWIFADFLERRQKVEWCKVGNNHNAKWMKTFSTVFLLTCH